MNRLRNLDGKATKHENRKDRQRQSDSVRGRTTRICFNTPKAGWSL